MTAHRSPSTRRRALAPLLITVVAACGGNDTTPNNAPPSAPSTTGGSTPAKPKAGAGLDLRVSNGKQGAPAFDHAKLAPARKLSDGDVNALLQRAKPITAEATDQQAFALRAKSQPPPQTGQTIQAAFPPPASSLLPPPAHTAEAELRVLRYMPEGKVPLAPELSVTFNQPMVAVTSQEDAAATTPVKLSPSAKGRWRWLGTRTILFDPEVRFPQATTFTVEVPAGTKSASGAALKQGAKFTFETPPPSLVAHYPMSGSQHVDVPMFMMFDQKIDAQAVLRKLTVTAAGKVQPIRLLDAKELAADKQLASISAGAKQAEQDGRWLAFRTTQSMPVDALVHVELAAGAPSAEGPNSTTQPQSFEFRTYPPLNIQRAECGWNHDCRPGMPFSIQFNNPLDGEKFDDSQLTISPAIPDVKIIQGGESITIIGATAPRTHYSVTVSSNLIDEFGQRLGKDDTRSFDVGDAMPTFYGVEGLVVLDPSAKQPTLDFFSTNYDQLKVQLYAVTPADFEAYTVMMRERWNHDKPPAIPGKKVFDSKVETHGGKNQLAETHVELKPALGATGLGHVIAVVEPTPWTEKSPPPRLVTWVQSTKLAIDAHIDAESLVAYAAELDTGKHASGVQLELRPYGTTATTDDTGLATLALSANQKGANYLIAHRGDDVAFVAEDNGYWSEGGSWFRQVRDKALAWYVTDDRKLYKPGEEVSLKGWLRTIDQGKNGDVGPVTAAVAIKYQVTDSTGNQIAKGTTQLDAVGGFDTKFTLPKTPNLGYAQVFFEATGGMVGSFAHAIQVEEFRRPEFEVSAQASQGPFLVGGGGDVTVNAKYYSGGPLAGADVNWSVTAAQTSFTPPNRDDYVFGAWTPWWMTGPFGGGEFDEEGGLIGRRAPKSWTLDSKTDATGAHTMHMDYLSVDPSLPMSVTATAQVMDVNRQAWTASSAMIVHPSSLYVGLKAKRPFVDKGVPFELDVIGVDIDGKLAAGAKIDLKTVRIDWEYKHGTYKTKEVDAQSCAVTSAAKP